jgi:hypothetical protein
MIQEKLLRCLSKKMKFRFERAIFIVDGYLSFTLSHITYFSSFVFHRTSDSIDFTHITVHRMVTVFV